MPQLSRCCTGGSAAVVVLINTPLFPAERPRGSCWPTTAWCCGSALNGEETPIYLPPAELSAKVRYVGRHHLPRRLGNLAHGPPVDVRRQPVALPRLCFASEHRRTIHPRVEMVDDISRSSMIRRACVKGYTSCPRHTAVLAATSDVPATAVRKVCPSFLELGIEVFLGDRLPGFTCNIRRRRGC